MAQKLVLRVTKAGRLTSAQSEDEAKSEEYIISSQDGVLRIELPVADPFGDKRQRQSVVGHLSNWAEGANCPASTSEHFGVKQDEGVLYLVAPHSARPDSEELSLLLDDVQKWLDTGGNAQVQKPESEATHESKQNPSQTPEPEPEPKPEPEPVFYDPEKNPEENLLALWGPDED